MKTHARIIKYIYIYDQEFMWSLDRYSMRSVAQGQKWKGAGRVLSTRRDLYTGKWRSLPNSVSQVDGALVSGHVEVLVFSYIEYSKIMAACRRYGKDK